MKDKDDRHEVSHQQSAVRKKLEEMERFARYLSRSVGYARDPPTADFQLGTKAKCREELWTRKERIIKWGQEIKWVWLLFPGNNYY